jgi:hypothetical protein
MKSEIGRKWLMKKGKRMVINWPKIQIEWVKSGDKLSPFLRSIGLDPTSGGTKSKTATWVKDAKFAQRNIQQYQESLPAPEVEIDRLYQTLTQWRKSQCRMVYGTAEKIMKLIESHINRFQKNPDNVKVDPIKSKEILDLANALKTVQKVMRLALGLSTENHGLPELPSTDVDDSDTKQHDDVPTFVVEMTANGKFRRDRPIQVN